MSDVPEEEKPEHPEKVPPPSFFQMVPANMADHLAGSIDDYTAGDVLGEYMHLPLREFLERMGVL